MGSSHEAEGCSPTDGGLSSPAMPKWHHKLLVPVSRSIEGLPELQLHLVGAAGIELYLLHVPVGKTIGTITGVSWIRLVQQGAK